MLNGGAVGEAVPEEHANADDDPDDPDEDPPAMLRIAMRAGAGAVISTGLHASLGGGNDLPPEPFVWRGAGGGGKPGQFFKQRQMQTHME